MRIFDPNNHRLLKGETKNLSQQRGNREIPLPLRRQIRRGVKSVGGDRQQGSV